MSCPPITGTLGESTQWCGYCSNGPHFVYHIGGPCPHSPSGSLEARLRCAAEDLGYDRAIALLRQWKEGF
jgi:hypothetical protein